MDFLNELFTLKWTPWYRWHPQLAIRYLPVVEWIRRFERSDPGVRQGRTFSVLEVGSGGLGITPYLQQPVTGVDLKFDPPIHPLLTPVVGDAAQLKFLDDSFDIVLSTDMLEHVLETKRQRAISEMLRIAREAVVIGFPCGKHAAKQDDELRQEYRNRHGKDFPFLKEQVEYGLPDETDILGYIKDSAKQLSKSIEVEIRGNTNLHMRRFLMTGWMSRNFIANLLFRKIFLLLIPVFRALERPPYYREIFFVRINKQ